MNLSGASSSPKQLVRKFTNISADYAEHSPILNMKSEVDPNKTISSNNMNADNSVSLV